MDQKYDRYPPCVADYISSVTGSLDRPSLVGMSALAPSRILTAKDCRDLPRLILDYNIVICSVHGEFKDILTLL